MMKLKRIVAIGSLLSIFLVAAGCGPSVRVAGSWTNPDVTPTEDYDKIMVSAMVSNEQAKRAIEDALEERLQEEAVECTKGYVLFPTMFSDRFEADKDRMLSEIQGEGNNAILTVSVLDEETETRYVPGTTGPYRPMSTYRWYGNFWGYYDYYYPLVYDPGYYSTTKVYYIEANLYDAQSEELVWSAQTEAYDPAQLENFADNFADTIVDELTDEELLRNETEEAQN